MAVSNGKEYDGGRPTPMRASDVIRKLQRLIDEHGDQPVVFYGEATANVRSIVAYDATGNSSGPIVKFHIHGW